MAHDNSLPPSDRGEAPDPEPDPAKKPKAKKAFDPELHARVVRYLEGTLFDWQKNLVGTRREVDKASLASEIGVSPALIHLYAKGEPVGDVPKLERSLKSVLRSAELRLQLGVGTTECETALQVSNGLRTISRSNQIGFIFGEAGEGKSRGVEWFINPKNPKGNSAALVVTLSRWSCDMRALGNLILDAYGRELWNALVKKGSPPRLWEHLATQLRGSNRLLIIDNAHKLTRGAVEALCDFYDATAIPIGLVGNPELLQRFDENDQRYSRVGFRLIVRPRNREPLVRHQLSEITPEATEELFSLAFDVASDKGHFRVLEKVLQLTVNFREAKKGDTWTTCFQAAHLHIRREAVKEKEAK